MIGPRGFELVIFDCDGVLIDSEVIACRIDAQALSALGYPITPQGIAERFIGLASGAMREIVERDLGRALPSKLEFLSQRRKSSPLSAQPRRSIDIPTSTMLRKTPTCRRGPLTNCSTMQSRTAALPI